MVTIRATRKKVPLVSINLAQVSYRFDPHGICLHYDVGDIVGSHFVQERDYTASGRSPLPGNYTHRIFQRTEIERWLKRTRFNRDVACSYVPWR